MALKRIVAIYDWPHESLASYRKVKLTVVVRIDIYIAILSAEPPINSGKMFWSGDQS